MSENLSVLTAAIDAYERHRATLPPDNGALPWELVGCDLRKIWIEAVQEEHDDLGSEPSRS